MNCEIQHGDARELADAITGPINCIIADPPYGVDFVSRKGVLPSAARFARKIENDGNIESAIELWSDVITRLTAKTPDDAEMYLFTKWDIIEPWANALRALAPIGWKYKMLLVWEKGYPGLGDIDANWGCGHELILYAKKGRRDVAERRSGVLHFDKPSTKGHIHPTEKPVPLLERLIEMSTNPGDLVVDPFAGSGSTIVAAQNLGRRGIGFEIDATYAKGAAERLDQPTMAF